MKTIRVILIAATLMLLCGVKLGFVGFHYPMVIQDEPLRNPQKVMRIDGTTIFLQNGRIIDLDYVDADGTGISNALRQSGFEIDVQEAKENFLWIWARKDGWVCGTPWAQKIVIPLIPDTVYKNRREMITVGSYVESNGDENKAEGGSNTIRPRMQPTPPATDPTSGRNKYE